MIAPLSALLRLHEFNCGITSATLGNIDRERLLAAVDPVVMARYERLLKRFGQSAVVPMERQVCSGCHMRQPAEPKHLDMDIYQCENCHRLLYDPDLACELSVGL